MEYIGLAQLFQGFGSLSHDRCSQPPLRIRFGKQGHLVLVGFEAFQRGMNILDGVAFLPLPVNAESHPQVRLRLFHRIVEVTPESRRCHASLNSIIQTPGIEIDIS